MPPIQRVAAIQPRAAGPGGAVVVLLEQNNSGLEYSVTVESEPDKRPGQTAPAVHVHCDGRSLSLATPRGTFFRWPGQRTGRTAVSIVANPTTAQPAEATVVLTFACQ